MATAHINADLGDNTVAWVRTSRSRFPELATAGTALYNERVSRFLSWYIEHSKRFDGLARETTKECEHILEEMSIAGIVHCRTKGPKSLKIKLASLSHDEEFLNWISGGAIKKRLHVLVQRSGHEVMDFLGRIEHILRDEDFQKWRPSDSLQNKLRELFQHIWTCRQYVADETLINQIKSLIDNPDFKTWISWEDHITRFREMGDLAGVRIGLYLPGDVVAVGTKIEDRFVLKHLFGTVSGGREVSQERNVLITEHGNGPFFDGENHWHHYGYKSWQLVVEWRNTQHKSFHFRKVEIQVGLVVSQAWAEIQHNVIYKKNADIRLTPTMKRMIDGINGLAITTEIMLNELEKNLEEATRQAKERNETPLNVWEDFPTWSKETCLDNMETEEREKW